MIARTAAIEMIAKWVHPTMATETRQMLYSPLKTMFSGAANALSPTRLGPLIARVGITQLVFKTPFAPFAATAIFARYLATMGVHGEIFQQVKNFVLGEFRAGGEKGPDPESKTESQTESKDVQTEAGEGPGHGAGDAPAKTEPQPEVKLSDSTDGHSVSVAEPSTGKGGGDPLPQGTALATNRDTFRSPRSNPPGQANNAPGGSPPTTFQDKLGAAVTMAALVGLALMYPPGQQLRK